jgi:uncharacterized protein YacL
MIANALRLGAAIVFGVLAFAFAGFGLVVAVKVRDQYGDSPDSTYLLIGGIGLVIAACLAFISWGLFHSRREHTSQALVLCTVVLAALFGLTTSPLFLLALILLVPLGALALSVTPEAEEGED